MRLFQPTAEPRVVAIHHILQRVLESDLPEGHDQFEFRLKEHALARVGVLKKIVKWGDARWELQPLMTWAHWLVEKEPDRDGTLESELGILLYEQAHYSEAEPLLRHMLKLAEEQHQYDHPEIASALNNLAELLDDTGRPQEAQSLLRRALAILENRMGKEHPYAAKVLSNLARSLQHESRLTEAEPLLRRAVAMAERTCGTDDLDFATHLHRLATLLQATNHPIP